MKSFNSRKILILFFLLCVNLVSFAQQTAEKYIVETNYLLYLPEGYENDTITRWPMMMFLHGVGECGEDIEKVKWLGPPSRIEAGHKYPFIVVSPQAAERGWKPELLAKLIDHLKQNLRIDDDRVYLTGLSMGGYGTWNTASIYPELFAAIIPICGGGFPENGWRIHMPVWCFHGDEDDVVALSQSQEMVDAVKEHNPNVKFTIYPGVAHDSWTETYNNEEVYEWMLSHKRFSFEEITLEPEVIEEYVGQYKNEDQILDVTVNEGRLKITMQNGYEAPPLYAAEKDKFYMEPHNVTNLYLFERDENNRVCRFVSAYGPHRSEYEKIND